jgi:hypothetical protein
MASLKRSSAAKTVMTYPGLVAIDRLTRKRRVVVGSLNREIVILAGVSGAVAVAVITEIATIEIVMETRGVMSRRICIRQRREAEAVHHVM